MHPPLAKRARLRVISPRQSVSLQSECLRRGTTVRLSDDVLLKIFYYYLDPSPRFWPRLVRVCRRWRHIVFASQQALHLRLFCVPGTPVLKTLDCWPTLPIIVEYGGTFALRSPLPEDEVNIITALEQSDRVSSISLTVTISLLKKLYAIKRPFFELEDLILLSRDTERLRLPSTFLWRLWSPRLRRLHLTRIDSFALLPLLHSSRNLVDLQLHEALTPWYIEEFMDALSGMPQLRSLSLHFPSIDDNYVSPRPPPPLYQRVVQLVLPALTRLKFRGVAECLERLVVRIDAPRLGDIQVTVFDSDNFSTTIARLGEFINRIEMHKSHHQARILSSDRTISISLTQPGAPRCLKLQLFSELLGDQLSTISLIFLHFSSLLLDVEDLRISATRPSSQGDSLYNERWLDLISLFTGVKWLHFDGNDSINIVRAIKEADGGRKPLSSLHKLYLPHPGGLHHAPLSEVVVSFMISRWDSGYPIGVEYERLCPISELHGTGPFSEPVMSDHEMLCNEILLNIFRRYLDATPRLWSILTHVCRRWKQVVLRSPLGLQLRLYCTYRTPVLAALDCWPPLPLVLDYGGPQMLDFPTTEDEDNMIAALKRSDRVNSISLALTNSLLGKLSTLSEPFSELEDLVLLPQDNLQLTLPGLPSAFRWGERLRTLHVTKIAIPALPQLLSSSTDLVDLQLHEIPMAGYFPPRALAIALSGASHLRSLSLHFLSFPPRRSYVGLPPPGHRISLSALTHLKYRGISKYLDAFVARIDAPLLGDIDITFFSQPTMDASQLGQFIERIDMQMSFAEADTQTSTHAISISFKNSITSTPLRLQILCKQLDWQVSSMAQVCRQFSPLLSGVQHLVFNTNDWSSGQDNVDGEQFLQLVRSFAGARSLSIAGELTTSILCALRPSDEGYTSNTTVLPSLRNIRVRKPMPLDRLFWDAAHLLITSRGLSSHPIELQFVCDDCNTGFTSQNLKDHLVSRHAYKMVCSYCGDFRSILQDIHRFQEHLRRNHPEVARNDELISQSHSTLTLLQCDALANRHSSLRKKRRSLLRPFR